MRVVTGFRAPLAFTVVALLLLVAAPVMASQPTPWQFATQYQPGTVAMLWTPFVLLLVPSVVTPGDVVLKRSSNE